MLRTCLFAEYSVQIFAQKARTINPWTIKPTRTYNTARIWNTQDAWKDVIVSTHGMKPYKESRDVTPVILQLGTLGGQSLVSKHAAFPLFFLSLLLFSFFMLFFTSIYSPPLSIIPFHPLFTTLHVILPFSFLSLIFFFFVFLRSHFGISSFFRDF